MKINAFTLISVFVAHFFLSHAFGKEHINTTPIISRYSIKGRIINFNNQVGEIQVSSNKGASGVTTVKFGSKLYFLKNKGDEDGLRQALDSIIATRILNRINNDLSRFPNLTLGYDDSDDELISFKVFSEGLINFKSLNDMSGDEISGLNLKDLENLFIGLVLVGGGDPHGDNIFYSFGSHLFSNIDFDVSFKKHISRNEQAKKEKVPNNNFRPIQSDLAIRDFDCSFPHSNFLTTTDTLFANKRDHYAKYRNDKINNKKIESSKILDAINKVLKVPLKDLTDIVEQVVSEIRSGLAHLNNNSHFIKTMSFLYNEDYKNYLLAFLTNRYFFFKCLNGVAFSNNEINNIKCAKCLEDSTFTEKNQYYKDEL